MFPLDADNGTREKALEYYEKCLERHSDLTREERKVRAKEMMVDKYPWVTSVLAILRDKGNPRYADAMRFVQAMGVRSRRIPVNPPESNGSTPAAVNGAPLPLVAMREWFGQHDTLTATWKEIEHFSGRRAGWYRNALSKLHDEGYRFETNAAGDVVVVERPYNRRDEIKSELQALMDKMEALKAELGGLE